MLVIRSMFFNVVAMLWLSVHGDTGIKLIVDTDMGFDVDDVGAISVAHALADQGHVDVLDIRHGRHVITPMIVCVSREECEPFAYRKAWQSWCPKTTWQRKDGDLDTLLEKCSLECSESGKINGLEVWFANLRSLWHEEGDEFSRRAAAHVMSAWQRKIRDHETLQ